MRTFLDTFDTACYSTRINIISGVSSYAGSPNFYGSELNPEPFSKTRIPLGSPADPPLDPLFSLQDFPVCVPQDVQLTWPENPTHVLPLMKNALSILGGFGRRLTMYNCVKQRRGQENMTQTNVEVIGAECARVCAHKAARH